jgi:hypothetical protein
MAKLVVVLKSLLMATCAVAIFGALTWQLRRLDAKRKRDIVSYGPVSHHVLFPRTRVKDQHGIGLPGNNVHQLPGRSGKS